MKRLLVVALPALLATLAGCGGTACTSAAAVPQNKDSLRSCTLAAGSTVTIDLTLCGKCSDSSPACQAEYRDGAIEVAPTVQQCQEQASCGVDPSCAVVSPHVTCTVAIPAGATSGELVVLGDQAYTTAFTIGQGTSCSL